MKSNFKTFADTVDRQIGLRLTGLGFERWQPEGRADFRRAYFRRKAPPEIHLLDLLFDKYERYRCGIDVAKFSGETAVTWFGEQRLAEEISLDALPCRYILRGNSLLGQGQFIPPFSRRMFGPKSAADWIVQRLIRELDIIEKWFRSGEFSSELVRFSVKGT
jgi:hypothetical protein